MSRNSKIHTQQLRDRFIDFTSTNAAIADHFLSSADYDLEMAINNYYRHSQSVPNPKDSKTLNRLFNKYEDPSNNDIIGIDGTLQYLEDLGYEPEDKVVLALAHFLEAPSAGVFERNKFVLKWQKAGGETLENQRKYIKQLEIKLNNDPEYFKQVYQFTFVFSLEEGQKSLPLETAVDYWRLLLADVYGEKIEYWIRFLENENRKVVSKDVWNMFFVFLQDFQEDPQLEKYDDTAAWPSLIDEFVEDFRENHPTVSTQHVTGS